jgi:hypothetical protein
MQRKIAPEKFRLQSFEIFVFWLDMKNSLTLLALFFFQQTFSQTVVKSKTYGDLTFKELDHGLAKVEPGKEEILKKTPTGTHGWLKDFEIINVTDSIQVQPKANFGVVYQVDAKDTVDIPVIIEWIYPQEVTNANGQKFKSIKYTTTRPTNTPSASSYSLDESYEMVKGNWQVNIYVEKKRVLSRSFILY